MSHLIEVAFLNGPGLVLFYLYWKEQEQVQAIGKRKAAPRMGKMMSAGRSMSVGFVPSSSANLKLLGDTWTATDKASLFFLCSLITNSSHHSLSFSNQYLFFFTFFFLFLINIYLYLFFFNRYIYLYLYTYICTAGNC